MWVCDDTKGLLVSKLSRVKLSRVKNLGLITESSQDTKQDAYSSQGLGSVSDLGCKRSRVRE
jgi:hypothetical protein